MFGTKAFDDPMVQMTCAEVAVGLDEMKTILHRNLRILEGYAARGELPSYAERIHLKFHSATAAERCTALATKLFRAAGAAGIYAEHAVRPDSRRHHRRASARLEPVRDHRAQLRRGDVRRRGDQGFLAVSALRNRK